MAADLTIVEGGRPFHMSVVERLWFFPDGSEYLRYSPHFHMIYRGGFRTNFPLTHGFVVVHEGKLSVKSFFGETRTKIHVQDQVWYLRGTSQRAPWEYAKQLRVQPFRGHSLKPIYG